MSLVPVWLFAIPFAAALICASVGVWFRSVCRPLCIAAMLGTAALAVASNFMVAADGPMQTFLGGWAPPIGIYFLVDHLNAFVATVVGVVGLVVVVGSGAAVERQLARRRVFFHALAMLNIAGLMGMTVTHDLFNMYVFVEVVSLSAYALTASGGRGAPRAALRYLLIGSLGASLYLIGVGFLLAETGSLNMTDVAARLGEADPRTLVVSGVLIVVGFAVKMGLFPLHAWMPDAYSRASAAGASLMAPLVTKVSAYAMIRVLFWVYGAALLREEALVLDLIAWAGAVAVVVGGVMALMQADLFRLLAYSSISQMGIVALGIGLANDASLTGGIMHIANDALMKGALFLAASAIFLRYNIRRVDQLRELRGRAPWLSATIVLSGLSLVGLPPMCGFFGKWYVLKGALEADRWVLAGMVVLGSLASAGYVARLIEALFFAQIPDERQPAASGPRVRLTVAAALLLGAGVLVLGLLSGPLIDSVIRPAVQAALGTGSGS